MVDLRDILKDNDLMGEVLSSHTGVLNRRKIDKALTDNGYILPLPNKVSFHLFNGADMYMVTWFPNVPNSSSTGKYGYEKLTMKG